MKNALLLRDTYNAFRMGDGDRILRNSKFEMLCASVRGHTKYMYKLWLWRFQAYVTAILTPKEAEEYLWNCTASTNGGTEQNIPNDNLVELHVQLVKINHQETGRELHIFECQESSSLCSSANGDERKSWKKMQQV